MGPKFLIIKAECLEFCILDEKIVFCRMTDLQLALYEAILKTPKFQLVMLVEDPCPCGSKYLAKHCCRKVRLYFNSIQCPNLLLFRRRKSFKGTFDPIVFLFLTFGIFFGCIVSQIYRMHINPTSS